jgi:hypothetical protein
MKDASNIDVILSFEDEMGMLAQSPETQAGQIQFMGILEEPEAG